MSFTCYFVSQGHFNIHLHISSMHSLPKKKEREQYNLQCPVMVCYIVVEYTNTIKMCSYAMKCISELFPCYI